MRIAEVAQPVPVRRNFDYEIPESIGPRAAPGTRVTAPFGPRRRLTGMVVSVREGEPKRALKPIEAVLDPEPLLSPDMLELARWMSARYGASMGECCKALVPSFIKPEKSRVPAPAASHAAETWREECDPRPAPASDEPEAPASPFQLTAGQKSALETLLAHLKTGTFKASLLFGVPASGKTEVYLRLFREVVENGGQALYLLPEISLTQPFFEELSRRAGFSVALWHSRLGIKERRSVWLGLRRGDVRVVVGARSAALLPFRDLRLAIMDEEQDESFKQDSQAPLYHAREVVLERAKRAGALAVFGSATPSLEAVEYADSGAWTLLEMPQRVSALDRPRVEMTQKPARQDSCISPELLSAVTDRLNRREQVILLVNRRGFSNFIICRKCGWVARCPGCALAFIHHEKGPDFELRCHHCGRRAKVPEACVACGKPGLSTAGVGTQKVAAEIKALIPASRVLRMDRDSVSKGVREDARIYEQFKSGKADILVGTKLVAKGFHFPDVTLVGVVDADTMLDMPDFRSAERTVQVLMQAAGRAGRAEKMGHVLIQTARPEHYALQAVARGDYLHFARREMQFRRELSYPPKATLIRLVLSGTSETTVASGAEEVGGRLRQLLGPSCEVLGPAPAVYQKLRGRWRHHLLVKSRETDLSSLALDAESLGKLDRLLARIEAVGVPPSLKMHVQVDPYDLF